MPTCMHWTARMKQQCKTAAVVAVIDSRPGLTPVTLGYCAKHATAHVGGK